MRANSSHKLTNQICYTHYYIMNKIIRDLLHVSKHLPFLKHIAKHQSIDMAKLMETGEKKTAKGLSCK